MFFFFFSSRRRHTRCSRDWSSDVCSSDLLQRQIRGARRWGRAARGELNDERVLARPVRSRPDGAAPVRREHRSEEHTSELQSRLHLVCRLLLEKKKNNTYRALTLHTRTTA